MLIKICGLRRAIDIEYVNLNNSIPYEEDTLLCVSTIHTEYNKD